MADINLRGAGEKKGPAYKEKGVINSGMFISIAILVVVFLVYFGLSGYTKGYQKNRIKSLEDEISSAAASLNSADLQRVIDFDRRASEINNLSSEFTHNSPAEMFPNIQKLVVEGVAVDSIEVVNSEGLSMEAAMTTNDFLIVAKQILSFKNSEYFKDAEISKMGRDSKTGSIEFSITMSI